VVLPGHGRHAQPVQLVDGCGGAFGVGRRVPDEQLERSTDDAAGSVHVVNGQLEAGEQVVSGLGPARTGQRDEGADPDRWGAHQLSTRTGR
jgi:hypothetical protein